MKKITRLLLVLAALALAGCAAPRTKNPADPLESFNRGVYQFNDAVDKAVVKPVAQGYNTVVPPPFRLMISNFFSNLDDILVTINDLLQLKIMQAVSDGGRVLVNSTVGLFGIVDIASQIGMPKHDEDFGQTLGRWGVGSGPYLVLPLLGPSTVRDGVGLYADNRPDKLRRVEHMRSRNQLYLTKTVNRRAQLLDEEQVLDEAALDRYEFIREAYLQRRHSLVYDGNPPREKYEEEENGFEYRETPVPGTSSSRKNAMPASVAKQPPPASVHKIWVAQRTGIR